MFPFDPETCQLHPSKHFRNTKMRKWGWSYADLRDALVQAHRVERKQESKFEVWVRKHGSKRLVVVYEEATDILRIITGTEGKE